MKGIKVFACLLMIVFISVFCCSCREPSEADELVRCLNERDKEGIMNLFCEKTNSSTSIDFEQQISNVLDLFGDGTITSYAWRVGPSETSWQKGEKVWEDYSIFIENI